MNKSIISLSLNDMHDFLFSFFLLIFFNDYCSEVCLRKSNWVNIEKERQWMGKTINSPTEKETAA